MCGNFLEDTFLKTMIWVQLILLSGSTKYFSLKKINLYCEDTWTDNKEAPAPIIWRLCNFCHLFGLSTLDMPLYYSLQKLISIPYPSSHKKSSESTFPIILFFPQSIFSFVLSISLEMQASTIFFHVPFHCCSKLIVKNDRVMCNEWIQFFL